MAVGTDKLIVDGKEIVGTKLSVESSTDNSATLSDGTTVNFKAVLADAFRTNEFDDQGNPKYLFQFGLVVSSVNKANELKKGAAENASPNDPK